MKKIIYIGAMCIIVLSGLSVTSETSNDCDCCSLLNLPSDYVTMIVVNGIDSYFVTTLSNVPPGYDVSNGEYSGWCIQRNKQMSKGVLHSIILYCSYDHNLPEIWQDDDWDKVNYIINHKQGEKIDVQEAIWYFIGDWPAKRPLAKEMIEEANQSGEGFCPKPGETMVVLVDSGKELSPVIQRSMIEVTVPAHHTLTVNIEGSGSVNKIPDQINYRYGIIVELTAVPDSGWSFDHWSGDLDSSNNSEIINMTDNKNVTAHFKMSSDDGGETPPSGRNSGGGQKPNKPPTADLSAGEPYIGFVGENIIFNASRSWDPDNYVTAWSWDFGDGSIGEGEIINHSYSSTGEYTVVLTVRDIKGAPNSANTTAIIIHPNRPPSNPKIIGPSEGIADIEYSFTIVSTDDDNDKIKYTIDWGDGTIDKIDFLPDDTKFNITHKWTEVGNYTIHVRADDNKTIVTEELAIKIDELQEAIVLEENNIALIILAILALLLLISFLILTKRRKKKEEENKERK